MKVHEIAEFLSASVTGNDEIEILRVADFHKAGDGDIAFLEKAEAVDQPTAACLIVPENFSVEATAKTAIIRVKNPKYAFALVAELLHPPKKFSVGIHPSAAISESTSIGANVFIGAFVSIGENSLIGNGTVINSGSAIGDNVKIGPNCRLHANVCIEDNCTIGDNVILHCGVVIGADGFGYVRGSSTTPSADHPADEASAPLLKPGGELKKFPQIGTVVIENDVEIGANTCIDRGALTETRIGEGTKIDNLVQIGHNCRIGKRVVIAAQTGISGSVVIEDDCIIGGQVGFGDHVRVQSGAVIGSQAGVLPGKIVRPGVWWGTPIQPLDEFKRHHANVKGIGRLKEEIKKLKQKIAL